MIKLMVMKIFCMLAALALPLAAGAARPAPENQEPPYSVRMMLSEMRRSPDACWLDGREGQIESVLMHPKRSLRGGF